MHWEPVPEYVPTVGAVHTEVLIPEYDEMASDVFIPPLRNRLDDLELLANHFIQSLNRSLEKNIT